MIVQAWATSLAEFNVCAPSARAASCALGAMSKLTAETLASFKRDNRAAAHRAGADKANFFHC